MKKWAITVVVAAALLAAAVYWNHWQAGRIMARAKNTDRQFFYEIIVREVPMDRSPLSFLLRFLPSDSYYTQCEFHRSFDNGRPWSYQTFTGESYTPSRARIEWRDENEAIVYLDETPYFKCVDGWWMKVK